MQRAAQARRQPSRPQPRSARRAWRALRLLPALLALAAGAARAGTLVSADYAEPTTRYAHGVLGDAVEWGALVLVLDGGTGSSLREYVIRLPETRVFEDLAPRIIKGDTGRPLVMTVESDMALGARLALYNESGLYAATPFIGRANRWLAPIGAADLDGDGWPELAYIDRPHLAKTLRIWRLKDGKLTEIAQAPGLTNHRIGEDFITSGLRDCGEGVEIITADSGWNRLISTRLEDGRAVSRSIGAYEGRDSMAAALDCR